MRTPSAAMVDLREGWLGRLGALAALLGFLFTATTPGLALVNSAGRSVVVNGVVGVYVCHAPDAPRTLPPADEPSTRDECCVVCQAAHLAAGALPPQGPLLAIRDGTPLRWPAEGNSDGKGGVVRHAQARAPPAG
ncbi:MAG: hypothetical protein NVV74_22120 [Magnetospirillum sp.]|nr:hypothetical protein [Magnetospirillum sp.]